MSDHIIISDFAKHEEHISRCAVEMDDQLFPQGGCLKVFALSLNGTVLAYFPCEAYRDAYAAMLNPKEEDA